MRAADDFSYIANRIALLRSNDAPEIAAVREQLASVTREQLAQLMLTAVQARMDRSGDCRQVDVGTERFQQKSTRVRLSTINGGMKVISVDPHVGRLLASDAEIQDRSFLACFDERMGEFIDEVVRLRGPVVLDLDANDVGDDVDDVDHVMSVEQAKKVWALYERAATPGEKEAARQALIRGGVWK